jgi:DNA-binding NtrC family response regulator
LAETLLGRICRASGFRRRPITAEGRRRIEQCPGPATCASWRTKSSARLCSKMALAFRHLDRMASGEEERPPLPCEEWFNPSFRFPPTGFSLEQAVDRIVQHALTQSEGNVSAAARLLGVSRDVVRYRVAGKGGKSDES